jgi:hypothetical protein
MKYNMNKFNLNISKFVSAFVITTFLVAPAFAFAENGRGNEGKNNEKKEIKIEKKEEKKDEKREESNMKKCFKAWGHLVAPGWMKLNKEATLSLDCIMPFGIGKKFRNGSTTPDIISPVISDIVIVPGIYKAVINWKTNEPTDNKIFYSTTTPVDISNAKSKTDRESNKDHKIVISNLSPDTTYYVLIQSRDRFGNTATSSTLSFKTLPPILDTTAPNINNVISTVGTSTINVGWKTNEPTSTKVYYSGTSGINPLSLSTLFVENTNLVETHLISIHGLSTNTPYYLLIESKDLSGNVSRTNEFSVTTTSGI